MSKAVDLVLKSRIAEGRWQLPGAGFKISGESQQSVILALAHLADYDKVTVSVATLQRVTGLSERMVQYILRLFRNERLLLVDDRRPSGRGAPVSYLIDMGMLEELTLRERQCLICDAGYSERREYERLGVCHSCVKRLANEFWKAHAGEPHPDFATREEIEAARAGRPARYVKELIPAELRWEVWERDNFTCKRCGSKRRLTIDHIHPESKGGKAELDNLQTLCKPCNSAKGTRSELPP